MVVSMYLRSEGHDVMMTGQVNTAETHRNESGRSNITKKYSVV